jgi:hypothetical protein
MRRLTWLSGLGVVSVTTSSVKSTSMSKILVCQMILVFLFGVFFKCSTFLVCLLVKVLVPQNTSIFNFLFTGSIIFECLNYLVNIRHFSNLL